MTRWGACELLNDAVGPGTDSFQDSNFSQMSSTGRTISLSVAIIKDEQKASWKITASGSRGAGRTSLEQSTTSVAALVGRIWVGPAVYTYFGLQLARKAQKNQGNWPLQVFQNVVAEVTEGIDVPAINRRQSVASTDTCSGGWPILKQGGNNQMPVISPSKSLDVLGRSLMLPVVNEPTNGAG
eukprot:CAMPEP_0206622384 /NCGR_PEP_ID=MMETSP0325_2-20121206/62766_1 /ASSEMBLY_ACC=CAM_ASM_000347 /TAXON_ID=2866 /ORGANISM="Crypthecodinium cohnii, Strain Seligo" /LENGTH=182 /DNA_ID=CAMNT_0054145683 /DNA_START=109 /DNA_END=657 /DNA_ORIENTATION=-